MIVLAQIQQNLIDALKTSGITQTELAKKLNIKQTQISCYIHGKKMPALDTFANLCAVLDLDANDILCISSNGKYINSFNNSFNNSGNITIK